MPGPRGPHSGVACACKCMIREQGGLIPCMGQPMSIDWKAVDVKNLHSSCLPSASSKLKPAEAGSHLTGAGEVRIMPAAVLKPSTTCWVAAEEPCGCPEAPMARLCSLSSASTAGWKPSLHMTSDIAHRACAVRSASQLVQGKCERTGGLHQELEQLKGTMLVKGAQVTPDGACS